jgi:hypothetical protein
MVSKCWTQPISGTTNPDAPVLVDHAFLELGQEKVDGLGRVVADDHFSGAH